jgi:dolichyl-phosphate-mannose--protein O-mannosyl transferase
MTLINIILAVKNLSNKERASQSPAILQETTLKPWRPLLALLLIISGITHFSFLTTPSSVVYDEVHFGKFSTAYCCTGENIFDVHPPHAKLLIAAAAKLGGYAGGFDFQNISEEFHDVPVFAYRFVPAFSGFALSFIIFVLIRQLGGSEAAAFFGAALYTFDNALLVQTRFILLEGVLLLGIFGALSAFLAGLQTDHTGKRVAWLLLAGAMAGLAVGTKFTGLTALGLIAVVSMVRVFQDFSAKNILKWAGRYLWVVFGAVAVYLFGWYLHFQLLDKPGFGDDFYRNTGHFFQDMLNIHEVMLRSNISLTDAHPDASPWWSWPFMTTPPFYWSGQGASIYLLGNPIIWWGTTLLTIVIACNVLLSKVTNLSWRVKTPQVSLWVPFMGYLIATLPYALMKRTLFMYHYLPPLIFSLIFVVLWLDSAGWIRVGGFTVQRKSYFAVLTVTLACFVFLSSVTYGYKHPTWYLIVLSTIFPHITL